MISVQLSKITCVTKFLRFKFLRKWAKKLNRLKMIFSIENAGGIEINSKKTLFSRLLGVQNMVTISREYYHEQLLYHL